MPGASPGMTTERASNRLLRLPPPLPLDGLAHQKLLDLPRDRHRKFVDEFHVVRNLVVRDLALTERANIVGGERFARTNPHPGAQLLAIAVVGDAEYLHVLDLGMAIQ